jgi:HD-like signal output (HDOD) protein
MMGRGVLSRAEVIQGLEALPAFPRVVTEILETLDDPDANLAVLVSHIQRDPVIAARVLSLANAAASAALHRATIDDLYIATSLIGTGRVREMAVISNMTNLFNRSTPSSMPSTFWQHSVAVAMCTQELAMRSGLHALMAPSLIAGLLHDIGQLWLQCYRGDAFGAAVAGAAQYDLCISDAERECCGVDHATIGGWLAEHWKLPAGICQAIRMHHAPDQSLDEPLVPLVHVAAVLSNALNLAPGAENRVSSISTPACEALGLVWNEGIRPLFGRMEARSRHANLIFRCAEAA